MADNIWNDIVTELEAQAMDFIPEDSANKAEDLSSNDNTHYPTTQAVAEALAAIALTPGAQGAPGIPGRDAEEPELPMMIPGPGYAASMGIRTDVAYASGNFTKDAGTWTVDSGDHLSLSYIIVGRTMFVTFEVDTSSVSGTASPVLRIKIPGGFTSTSRSPAQFYFNDNGTRGVGLALVLSGETTIRLLKTDLSNWTNSINNTAATGMIMIYI